ncbi:MAG: hypothetical protein IAB81_02770 [Bacteroidetes bacterium]|uniref:Uncharacterized protein n=1 Tax=Candidatus Merdivivens pullicola TaxID=2840872 RepID=A0A9D9II61_9BACT|nr:hypothetical protein [Candidatus Merdivivens pullicola]
MENTIKGIMADCEVHGICDGYLSRWKECRSRKEMFDLGCTTEGQMFLSKCSSEGWGFSRDSIVSEFAPFINGRYVSRHEGDNGRSYLSKIYCGYKGGVKADTTLCGFIGCDCSVVVPRNMVCRIYADASSVLHVFCQDSSVVQIESYTDNITVEGKGRSRIVRL